MKKEEKKEQRYNIKKVTMEGVERKFDKGMEGFRRVQREVGAVQRMAGTVKGEWDAGLEGLNDFIWGPRQKREGDRSSSRTNSYDDERDDRRERQQRKPVGGSGSVEITVEIHNEDIVRAMEAAGIDPETVPREFLSDVRKAFKYQLSQSIERNLQTMLTKTVEVVDDEYSRTYGRKG